MAENLDQYTVAYLNDILIYLKTLKEHQKHVSNVLEKLSKQQLKIKGEKCDFHKHKIDFLRFVIKREDVKIDPKKIKKILDWPESRNLTKLQKFLRFGNYNRQFISGYSLIALPLTELTKKNILFV